MRSWSTQCGLWPKKLLAGWMMPEGCQEPSMDDLKEWQGSKLEMSKRQAKAEMSPNFEDINKCRRPIRSQETSMAEEQGDKVPWGQAVGWPIWSHLTCG